jgi:hypothetical protein
MRAVLWLCGPNISTSPLLQQCRQRCTRETDGQTQEPEGIDPDGVFWWSERNAGLDKEDGMETWVPLAAASS